MFLRNGSLDWRHTRKSTSVNTRELVSVFHSDKLIYDLIPNDFRQFKTTLRTPLYIISTKIAVKVISTLVAATESYMLQFAVLDRVLTMFNFCNLA